MKISTTLKVTATIEIDSDEARVLEHLTSYSLIDWFAAHCNEREIPAERIKTVLSDLRGKLHRIAACEEAIRVEASKWMQA